ncbi:MAG: hypothetical protein ACUVSC_06260 [Candidatus Fervidibacter sp.]|uniref:hypothetical protein n=1 Tax=Candidatus Fervidibacter sp. TaxID=3100871 RepID=UPI00404B7CD7
MRAAFLMGLIIGTVTILQAQTLSTKDGLQLSFAPDSTIKAIGLRNKPFAGVGGFFAAEPQGTPENLRWTPLKGKVEQKGDTVSVRAIGLGLEINATFTERADAIFCSGVLRDTTNSDRAIVLAFALPINATGWQWWDNLRTARHIDEKVSTRYAATISYGARGEHSPYPLCAINTGEAGIALGIPLNLPVVHRFVYDAAQKQLRLEWDFGLSPDGGTRGEKKETRQSSTATFRFAIYTLDEPSWGMRAAVDKFYHLFPESFQVRVKRLGIWMPFTDIAQIADFEDFGFAYHEGAQNPDFNRQHDIYNFRYEEPWSAWFFLPPDAPTDMTLEQLFAFPNRREQHPNLAEIVKSCGVQDEKGRFSMRSHKTDPVHWAGGQTLYNFLVNADPDIAKEEGVATKAKAMDGTLRTVLSDERLDGVYFDGFGEWVMPNENYRRDHWRVFEFPLTFSWRTKSPTQIASFGIYEYLSYAAEQLHAAGKLVMANGFGYGFPFHAHWVDVGGNEIRWTKERDDFVFFDYRRVLAYRKPYLPLNDEFFNTEFTEDVAEDYFRWALFYGFLPSCFAPGAGSFGNYWNTPEFHNRDRHLFRRYIPLIVRICEAGWEPITHAWSSNEQVLVERFGRWSESNLHFTLYNPTDELQNTAIAIDAAKLGLRKQDVVKLRVWVLTDLKPFAFAVGETKFSQLTILLSGVMAPHETALIWLAPSDQVATSLTSLARTHLQRAIRKSQRRPQAPETLKSDTKRVAETMPKTDSDWAKWLAQLQDLEESWSQQPDGKNVAHDFAEARRIVGAMVREQLSLQTDAVLPESLAAGEIVRLPVDVRNAGKETVKDARLTAVLSLGAGDLNAQTFELPLGDLTPKALRRELIVLKVPTDWEGRRATIQVALKGTVMDTKVSLPIDETSLRISAPLEIEVKQFGSKASILVRLRNNTSESRKVTVTVQSPLEFAPSEETLKARTTTEVKLVPAKPLHELQLSSAKVKVQWEGQEREGKVERWLSLIVLPESDNLLRNGSFEEGNEPPLPSWNFYGLGYLLSDDAVDGKRSIFCKSNDTQKMYGAVQTLTLDRKEPTPLILHGFSKGEGVAPKILSGDYSLYLDAYYVDGTPLWGEIVPFSGTGWQWGWRLVVPKKPLREVIVYALFRYRTGRAWFDSVGLNELKMPPSLAKVEANSTDLLKLTDGDFRTIWQGSGESVITLVVPSEKSVRQVAIWWLYPEQKAETVSMQIWDGKAWKQVAERPTDEDTWLTVVDFAEVKTSQLKVILHGRTYAVREVEVR